jgi:hypothetical protein
MGVDEELIALSRSLVVELAGSIGFRNSRLVQNIVWPIFRPATDALARIGLTFDRNVQQHGFARAMGIALENFASKVIVRGSGRTPAEGPLLVVSNHPGTYDSLVVSSQLQRDDLNFISGDIPFLRNLPHAHQHFFCISDDGNGRTMAARKAIRHLKDGGALILFGFGHIDPDPSVYDNPSTMIDHWSPSIDLFLRVAPETRVQITMMSHVVSPRWRNSLLYHLRKEPLDKRRLVEFGQVIYQLLFPRRLLTTPRISFDQPVGVKDLLQESGTAHVLPAVITRGKALLADHIRWSAVSAKS